MYQISYYLRYKCIFDLKMYNYCKITTNIKILMTELRVISGIMGR